MENNKLCILCYISDKTTINIFDEEGIQLNIADILRKHFWFKIIENDGCTNVICTDCWWKTVNFYNFYNIVEIAHNNFSHVTNKMKKSQNNKILNKSMIGENDEKYCNNNNGINVIKTENNDIIFDINQICEQLVDGFGNDSFNNTITKEEKIIVKPDIDVGVENGLKEEYLQLNDAIKCAVDDDDDDDVHDDDDDDDDDDDADNDDCDNIDDVIKNNVKKAPKRKLKMKTNKIISERKYNKRKTNKKCNKNNDSDEDLLAVEKKLQMDKEDAQMLDFFNMECDICKFKCSSFLETLSHYREKHDTTGYISCCQRKFFRRGKILDHITFHLNPDAFKCQYCNKLYTDKYVLSNHIDSVHIPSDGKPYKCNICTKSFSKQFQLTQHLKTGHLGDADKKFSCNDCGKSFISKYNLTAHIRGVHENAYVHICDICAKVFKSKPILESHRETHIGNESRIRLQCNICGAWLKKKSLRTHLAQHENDARTCPKCGKETVNKESLRNHLKYVHAERKHICKMCDKGFKKPVELREHMASHTGEILYTCPYCPKTFTCGPNMRSHRKIAHPIEWQEDRKKIITQYHNNN